MAKLDGLVARPLRSSIARKRHELIRTVTGRDPSRLPREGFNTALS